MRTYCVAQETLLSAQWRPKQEENPPRKMCVYILLIHFVVQQKLTQHCQSTVHLCMCAQSRLTPCGPVDCSPPGSPVMGFSRKEYWNELPCPPPIPFINDF